MIYDTALPIYLQVITCIKQDIVTGKLAPGDKLPSGRDLALKYTINPNTAARVYQELERQGLCFTRRGLGTFITEDVSMLSALREEMADDLLLKFLEGMRQLGISAEEASGLIRKKISDPAYLKAQQEA